MTSTIKETFETWKYYFLMVGVLAPFYIAALIFYQLSKTKLSLLDYKSISLVFYVIFSTWIGHPIVFLCLVYTWLFLSWIKQVFLNICSNFGDFFYNLKISRRNKRYGKKAEKKAVS